MSILESDRSLLIRALHAVGYEDDILVDQPIRPDGYNYSLTPYTFVGDRQAKVDGVLWTIPPGQSSRVVRVEKAGGIFQDVPIEGSGYFLSIDPEGEIISYTFAHPIVDSTMVEYGPGWVTTWIAEREFKVVGLTTPPFQENMESFIPIDDPQLPSEFWVKYWKLRGREENSI